MEKRNWERLAGLAGIVLVGFFVAGIFAGGSPPSPSDSNDAVKAYFVDNRDQLVFQGWLFAVGAMLFLWWGSAVRSALRQGEEAGGHLANTFYAAIVATGAVMMVVLSVQTGLIYKAVADVDANVVRAVFDICTLGAVFFSLFLALAALAYAVLTMTEAIFPSWTAWLAVIVAGLNLVSPLTVFRTDGAFSGEGAFGFVGFAANMIFILVVSIVMLQKTEPATS